MSSKPRRLTRDEPAPGLVIYQPAGGFRYSMDPFLLAAWALEGGAPASAVDVGTGSGIMALLLASRGCRVTGVDVMPEWVALARASARESGLAVEFVEADVRRLPPSDHDLALMNPPYLSPGAGPLSADPLKAAARTALNGDLGELVAASGRLARRVALVLPAARRGEGLQAMEACGLETVRLCVLGEVLVLLEGRRDGGGGDLSVETSAIRVGDGWSARVRGLYASLGARLRQEGEGRAVGAR